MRMQQKKLIKPIDKPINKIDKNNYIFLNQIHNISSSSIWNDYKIDKLWLYNLHYFNNYDENLIVRWIQENPPKKGIGWESYPTSLRIVNWIKQYLEGFSFSQEALDSLFIQTRWLIKRLEWHLLANHLFANAKALIFAGLFFSGTEADYWLNKGITILNQQLKQQILHNGSHFELTPMYHAIILEDMLDLINIMHIYNYPVPNNWFNLITKMFNWLNYISHPDGKIAFFNDATFGVAPNIDELIKYAQNLKIIAKTNNIVKSINYYRLTKDRITLIADAGVIGPNYQPGHAHADTLSFELSIDKQRVLVNSGISSYIGHDRKYQRGTSAHNTVSIDNINSSEVWSNFRVARRANIIKKNFIKNEHYYSLSASHNGYMHLKGKPKHQRTWKLGDKKLLITDIITGKYKHNIKIYFHFHPDMNLIKINDDRVEIRNSCGNTLANLIASDQTELTIKNGHYFPEFGKSMANKSIIIEKHDKLPLEIITQLNLAE
jgi:uncharacterized heparinase superfamily protein